MRLDQSCHEHQRVRSWYVLHARTRNFNKTVSRDGCHERFRDRYVLAAFTKLNNARYERPQPLAA